jgi:hypothetical protein
MFRSRIVVRPIALALAFAFTTAPLTAMAADKPRLALKSSELARGSFPMSAKMFREHVEKRIAKARELMNKKMTEHKVPAAQAAEIRKHFEAAVKQVREAADKVASDGTVTKEEAAEVRAVAKDLRHKARGERRARAKKQTPA